MKRSKSSRILKILSYVLLITGMIVILYPFYLTIITALKTPQESSQSFFSFPQSFYLGNFVNVLQKANYFVFFRNSAVVTLVSVFLIMVLIPMCSYAIARNMEKRYYKTMYFYLLAGIFVPFQVIMVPLVKYLAKLKLCNIPGLIIMCVTLASSQGVFLLVNYIRSVPRDLEEAAYIDGCGTVKAYVKIVLPMIKPILATIFVLNALWVWNDFQMPLLILNQSQDMWTLPLEFVVDTYKENTVKVFIQCVGETAFRFRMYTPGNEHPFDNSIYQLEGQNGVNITENEEFISISKGKIEARVRKYPWEVSYYLDGKLKTKEQIKDSNVDNMCKNLPVGFTYDENKEIIGVNETMYLYADEEFYGFGEKFTDFGKRGQTINCWQTDALSTNTEKSYKNHPFFMSSRGYAILLNTYTRSKFEMGSFSNVAYNMSVEDKVLDYVIWMGNDYKALLKSYINQTGKIPMIPKWALGLWMSKCSYQTQDEIYEVVKISKERDIKIDVIHIDGWQKEGDAGAWVWDYERFPNPEEMIYKLKKEGIHLCLWIFPYIDENSKYFKEAEEKGFLVKNTKGVTSRFYSTATSTSKVGCFDFTNPHFIEWYKPKVRSVVSMGIGAVKTDFSEAVPEDAVYFDGSTGIQGHNKLTFLYAKTIYDIMAEVKIPLGELPMLWGRSGYAGSHTIPAAWAGDSSTHLNNHACILRGGLSASMSGIPFWGFDMGGFYNTDHEGYECVPTDEEYIRSCQFGFFNSLSRCHGKTPREPWNFGEKAEKIFKKFNDIRHLLLPYLYSTTYKTHLSDIPVIRPVVMEYPEDRSARNVELEYFLGDSLLVVPVFDQEDEIDVYLPNGQWIDLFTHERIKGGRWVKRKIELDKIPVFIRQNKMIPMLTKIPENIEEKYENLDVILFCEDEIRDTYIDDGNVQNLKAKIEEGTLFINTDMDASYFTVYAEKCLDNAVVNGQNWEIKKEKEGYYKVALEK